MREIVMLPEVAMMLCVSAMLLGVAGSSAVHSVPLTLACTVAAPNLTVTLASGLQNPQTIARDGAACSTMPSP